MLFRDQCVFIRKSFGDAATAAVPALRRRKRRRLLIRVARSYSISQKP
jgi:hypothetical protein